MGLRELRLDRGTVLTVLALALLRLVAAAYTPLTFDEAYYWMWSKHLAGGYYDHPPMVAVVIRLGTMIAGDTELGVRLVSVLLGLPMSWAVYRTAGILFGGRRMAASATILLNVTMMAAVGTLIVTPDAPLLVASSFVLFYLAKVLETGRGAWWLAVGAAVGAALLSKYTALFFGPAILIWLVSVPKLRHWLISPWPYLGAMVSLAIFSPVLLWNANHQWVSFIKQIGRATRIEGFNPAFIERIDPDPDRFCNAIGIHPRRDGALRADVARRRALASRALINSIYWTIVAVFRWHSLHGRVEANWSRPVIPRLHRAAGAADARDGMRASNASSISVGAGPRHRNLMFAALVLQANTGWLSGYRRDATVRSIGVGMRELAAEVETVRVRLGAACVLAPDYGTIGWLAFYLPRGSCVVQRGERIRWVNMPEPDPALLAGKLLFVDEVREAGQPELTANFARVEKVAVFTRKRGPLIIKLGRPICSKARRAT